MMRKWSRSPRDSGLGCLVPGAFGFGFGDPAGDGGGVCPGVQGGPVLGELAVTFGDLGLDLVLSGGYLGLAVRAENLIHGSDQHSCSSGALPVMLTGHVPAVRFPPDHATSRVAATVPARGGVEDSRDLGPQPEPDCPARDDVASVATELGSNAIRHTASGRGGWFVVEVAWFRPVVRVAVTDDGAAAGPRVIDDPAGEHGRGLLVVAGLSVRTGVVGDHRGRLVWADVPWDDASIADCHGWRVSQNRQRCRYRGPVSSQRMPGGVVHKLPADLRKALIANPTALDAWKDITPLARNEFICWVEDAKQEMTRERRIRRTQEELEEGQRRPCCWPGCRHRERTGT
jgi:Bacteriocin-protection, YdeI or OmpD-Associated